MLTHRRGRFVSIVPRRLIRRCTISDLNGGFETNTTGWAGGGTIARQTTTAHSGVASALVTTAGAGGTGVAATMTGDAAQGTNWDAAGYYQAHGAGDIGRTVELLVGTVGGSAENFTAPIVTLTAGWQQTSVAVAFANASHTAATVNALQVGAGAAVLFDLDDVTLARHLAYAPAGVPLVTGLWVPGKPAGNYSEPSDAATAQLITSGLYSGA